MPLPPDIRLIAIDLDGTLLNSAKQVDDATADALTAIALAGDIKVVLASARPPRSVRPTYQRLGLDTLQVNYNGALIWNESARAAAYHLPLAAPLVQQIIAAARDMYEEIQVTCEILDRWYTDHFDPTHTTETGRLFKPDVISPLEKFAHLDVTKLMFLGEPRITLRLETFIAQTFQDTVTVVRTDEDLIQIMEKNVSKAKAVEQVAQTYGLTLSNVLAIGDAPNDYAMIATSAIGVAMANAHPLCKDVATWIAPSNNDQGVLATLKHFHLA